MPPFVTAHTFCASPVWSKIFKFLKKFAYYTVYDYEENADVSKGYQNPKRKLGVTMHFSEIIELKCVVTNIFLFRFQQILIWLRSAFSP